MWWRILLALGGISFVGTGIGVLTDETCLGVTWSNEGAGARRLFTATCWPWSPDSPQMAGTGAWEPSAAGWLLLAAGLGMTVIAAWPVIQTWRATASYGPKVNYAPSYSPPTTPVIQERPPRPSLGAPQADASGIDAAHHDLYTKYNVGVAVMTAHVIWLEPLQRWLVAEGFGSSQGPMLHRKQEFDTKNEALDHLRREGYDITSPVPYESGRQSGDRGI